MYEAHFGFKANPFRIAPDPKFFFASAGHKRGLAYLRYGLHQGQGFVVVTGEPGTGKTMLIHTLLSELSKDDYSIAAITSTNLRAEDVLRAVAENFGIDQRSALNKAELLTFIQKFLVEQHEAGKKSLMIVDEAQNLPPRSLEELRMLSNFQIGHEGLLQIILAGQPQLRKTLAAPSMEQLSQRIIAGCHLKAISAVETRGYIMHRLTRVGWQGEPNFSSEALSLIFQISRGIPRLINVLVDRLLLSVCLDEQVSIDEARLRAVLIELQDESANVWVSSVGEFRADASLAPLPDPENQAEMGTPQSPRRREVSPASITPPRVAAAPHRTPAPSSPVSAVSRAAIPDELPDVQNALAEPEDVAASAVKIRSKIVKAVGGRAAQLVQMKAPKEDSSEAAKPEPKKAAPQPKQAVKPKPTPEPTPEPVKAQPQRRAARDDVLAPAKLPPRAVMRKEENVIALPVKSHPKIAPPPLASSEPLIPEDIAIPSIPEADVTAPVVADYGQPFGESKQRFEISARVQKVGLVGGLVLGLAVAAAFFLMGESAEPESVVPAPPLEAVASPRVPAPALPVTSESSRASLFDPRESLAVSDKPALPVPVVATEATTLPPLPEPTVLEGAIPEWELADLVYTYILAYENGNLSLFNTLFTDDVVVAGRVGRDAVVSYHDVLFSSTEMRSMSMNSIKWSWRDDVLHGIGLYDITEWKVMGAEPKLSSGRVTLEVRKLGSRYQVSKVEYL